MSKLQEILDLHNTHESRIAALKDKTIVVPPWGGPHGLQSEYDPSMHPVNNKAVYPDQITKDGITPVTRITLGWQRLAAKRMAELACGIPIKRVYHPDNDRQKEIATYIERIFQRNRIDSIHTDRWRKLFSACEVMTLWYAVDEPNDLYGFHSLLKLRCRVFTPMLGDELYPLFDEYGDMIAMSVAYRRRVGSKFVDFFDTYASDRHIKWSTESGAWEIVEDEQTTLGKIPAIYAWRPTPIWEDTSSNVYEVEWSLSRNGNYLRENSKPTLCVFADEVMKYGDEKDPNKEFRAVVQLPTNGKAEYVTWPQATESLKYHIDTLRNLFFTELQLPDWSYEKMSQMALSGESRKQLFIDAQMKVKDESGRIIEACDREINVIKAFLKAMLPDNYASDIDTLSVETEITPFSINDDKDTINNLQAANGGLPIISQRESIELLGWSDDVDQTLKEIQSQDVQDVFNPIDE